MNRSAERGPYSEGGSEPVVPGRAGDRRGLARCTGDAGGVDGAAAMDPIGAAAAALTRVRVVNIYAQRAALAAGQPVADQLKAPPARQLPAADQHRPCRVPQRALRRTLSVGARRNQGSPGGASSRPGTCVVPRGYEEYGQAMTLRGAGVLAALAVIAVTGFLVLSDSDEPASDEAGAPRAERPANATEATCETAVRGGAGQLAGKNDVVLDLLVLVGARYAASRRPDAFNGHGYKVPVRLPGRATATLSVPSGLRGRVGLVYSLATQDRVNTIGVSAADPVVRFTSCSAVGVPTGWPGGLVVDRPRCATLIVKVGDRAPKRRRVALGRRC